MKEGSVKNRNADYSIIISDQKIKSSELFGDKRELIIIHEDSEYKLRITNNNKMILIK